MKNETISIIGCGKIGNAVAYYFAKLGFNNLNLVDLDKETINQTKLFLNSYFKNIYYTENWKNSAICILCVPWESTVYFLKEILKLEKKNRPYVVSIARPNYNEFEMVKNEMENEIFFFSPCGLEPGLTEIFATYLTNRIQSEIETLNIFCGGVPLFAKKPLYYSLLYGDKLPIKIRPTWYKQNSAICNTMRFEGIEKKFFDTVGLLEAFHDGMLPFFINSSILKNIKNVSQKTLRWPGYCDTIKLLREFGLFDENILNEKINISPLDFFHTLLKEKNILNSSFDMTLLKIEAITTKNKIFNFQLIDHYDDEIKLSSMSKVTGFTACFSALKILEKDPQQKKYQYPYEFFSDSDIKQLINEMKIYCNTKFLENGDLI